MAGAPEIRPQIRKAWDMVDEAKEEIENLSAEEVKAELDAAAVIVDIRDFRERYLRGGSRAPSTRTGDAGVLDRPTASEYYRDRFTPDKRYILYCAGGDGPRSAPRP
jgi:rhodanese-related sulfurtransferase